MSFVSPTHQDLSNDANFSQIKSRVPVPLRDGKTVRIPAWGKKDTYSTVPVTVRYPFTRQQKR